MLTHSIDISDAKGFLYEVQNKKNRNSYEESVLASMLMDRKNVLDLKIVVGVDISGSISREQFKQSMQQIDAIRGLSMVMCMEVDDKVRSLYNYYKVAQSQVMRLRGGGGTEFSEFFQKAKAMKPDAILMLTDGQVWGDIKDPGIPTGWILTHDGRKPYNFGKVVLKLPSPLAA